jgi:hypothetical protein
MLGGCERGERLAEQRRLAAIRQRENAQDANRGKGSVQYRVGQSVLVRRPADGRWIQSNVLSYSARDGYLIQYLDTYQKMWVPADIIQRQVQQPQPNNQPRPQYRAGEMVIVQRPSDQRWVQSGVLGQDPRNGVLIQFLDTYQNMWVPTTIVRRAQHPQSNPNNTGRTGGAFQSGQIVLVLRPADRQWVQSRVVSTDPMNGVFVQYLDNYQSMWVSPNDVRRR